MASGVQWVKGDSGDFKRLGASRDPEAIEPLVKALGDDNGDVRIAVATALGQLGDPRA